MIACLPILSEDEPEIARLVGLGERFRYWRGTSGRRHLFSAVPAEVLADFRSVVVMFAEPAGKGRFVARAVCMIDGAGKGLAECRAFAEPAFGLRVFVHFLAANDTDRRRLVDDLAAAALKLAA